AGVRLNPLWYRLEDFRPALLERTGARWHYTVDELADISLGSEEFSTVIEDAELEQLSQGMWHRDARNPQSPNRPAQPEHQPSPITFEAFQAELKDALDHQGHPTIAAGFDALRRAWARPARISGEVYFNADKGRWEVNDKSGRYMSGKLRPDVTPA